MGVGGMAVRAVERLPLLHDQDETAWLDVMAELARAGRTEELDLPHLADYLSDMARRDRRELESRLVILLNHLFKWTHQPAHRSRSWRSTVVERRQEMNRLAGRGVLRNHGETVLAELDPEAAECPFPFDQLLTVKLSEEPV